MRPVQLLPSGTSVKTSAPGASTQLGAIVLGGIVVCTVAGYFLMARLDTVNQETVQARSQTQQVNNDVQTVTAQLVEAGNEKDWNSTAQGMREDLFKRLSERIDYALLAREVTTIKPTGAWYSAVSASNPSASGQAGSSSRTVKISGYAQSMELVSALVTRVDATDTLDDARLSDVQYVKDNKNRIWVEFAIDAALQDAAKVLDTPDATDPNSVTVGNEQGESLSLEPEPGFERRKSDAEKAAAAQAAKTAKAKAEAAAKAAAKAQAAEAVKAAKLAKQQAAAKRRAKKAALTNLQKVAKDAANGGGH